MSGTDRWSSQALKNRVPVHVYGSPLTSQQGDLPVGLLLILNEVDWCKAQLTEYWRQR
ncbi:MAG TPA: hypothetical protein VLE46_08060 [Nitrospira sp.]|nr:hypothetical protein [Nitrospira sp.]